MSRISTLLLGAIWLLCAPAQAQVVLNEIYGDPNAGKHEFFELFNTSTDNASQSMDAYTLVAYFEDPRAGFYVLDLPDLTVGPRGFFVGASSIPFNYQGVTASTNADFSWNDPALAAKNGYLQKWVLGSANASDGNTAYDLEPVGANFNNLFYVRSAQSASYSVFVFKNGILVNALLGGAGGGKTIPGFLTSMPALQITNRCAQPTTFTFNPQALKPSQIEYITEDAGADNGYIRTRDGLCGSWKKSSTQINHTPKMSSGLQTSVTGGLTIMASVVRGATAADPARVFYNVTDGPADLFPVELQVYTDNGSVKNELDANDVFLTSNTETVVTNGPFNTTFTPATADILIVAKSVSGCWDQVILVKDIYPAPITLPVRLLAFQGNVQNNSALLQWTVAENETGNFFEVERSTDGTNFTKAAVVFNSEKRGSETYYYKEPLTQPGTYYRLRILNKDGSGRYSSILLLRSGQQPAASLRLMQNPVGSTLSLTYQAAAGSTATISIYNAMGVKTRTATARFQQGENTYSLPLGSTLSPGTYLVEVISNGGKHTQKFIKQ